MKNRNMDFVPGFELGRESVKSVNAGILATVLRELVTRYEQTRQGKLQHCDCQIACRDNLEIRRRKFRKTDDEGFESDEDARSSTSSCCLVEDHVFKGGKNTDNDRSSPSAASQNGSTDSANSSGSSDTDDQDSPLPINTPKEIYPIGNVIFCHTEPRYPNTIAWVVKKTTTQFDTTTSRLGKTGVESINSGDHCLEVIVVRCKQPEDFKKLCETYRELSRRVKLDQYKSIGRKKPIVLSTITETNIKVSLSDMKVGRSSLLKASELSILHPKIMTSFRTEMKNSISLTSLLKQEPKCEVTEPNEEIIKKASSLSNISNRFNLLQRTDTDGMTHLEVSKSKSKIQKEIEGVILTEVDNSYKKEPVRQRRNSPQRTAETPPVRPERKKYLRKKTIHNENQSPQPVQEVKSKSKFYLPIEDETPNKLRPWTEASTWKLDTNRISRKSDERFIGDHRRSRSVGRPVRKPPMAYRYIDIDITNKLPNGVDVKTTHLPLKIPSQIRERRRRNSFDDVMEQKSSLKPVIKNNNNKKATNKYYCEPKKVTFSAFAQVQVVD